ncbi:MAG: glucosamine-6-phosphate deaminase [Candidatus Nanoarchaeia archaeon]
MQVIIRPSTEEATKLAAKIIAKKIREKPDAILGLATGNTMERLYAELVRMHRTEGLDFSLVKTFNLDEYIGLAPENPHSYRFYMNKHLFCDININIGNTFVLNGMAKDLKEECSRYEKKIKDLGGIDLQILGIGKDGHIGFNEPLSALRSRTRDKSLTPVTIAQNAPLFDKPEDMPRRALTMGIGTILDARELLMLVTGESKAEIIAKAVEGPITSMISATAIQLHERCTVIVDEPAARFLQGRDYYDWIFQNEPEWAPFR